MKISEEFSGSLMKAADLGKDAVTYTISNVKLQQFKDDEPKKVVLSFEEITQELALNNTNRKMLVELLGDDTDDWLGQAITLYKGKVPYQGNMVDSIKIDDRPQLPPQRGAAPAPRNVVANANPSQSNAPRTSIRTAVKERAREAVAVGAEDEDNSDPFQDE